MVESECTAFLGKGTIEDAREQEVAWDELCLPKSEGGLGLGKLGL